MPDTALPRSPALLDAAGAAALIASYAAEFLMIFLVRPSPSARALLPVFTYSPVAFAWAWRRLHG